MVDVDTLLSAAYIVSGDAGRLISGPGDAVDRGANRRGTQLVPFQSLCFICTFAEVLGEAIVPAAFVAEAPVDQPVKLNPDIPGKTHMTYTVQRH